MERHLKVITPRIRQTLYAVGTIATSVLTLLSLWSIVSPDAASSISSALAALLSLAGAGAAGTAAVITGKQRHDGTFDKADPVGQVTQGVQAVQDQLAQAKAQAEAVKAAVSNVVDDVPVLGPIAADALSRIKF